MDAVRAADHQGAAMAPCEIRGRVDEALQLADHEIGCVAQGPAPRRVDDIGAGETVVNIGSGGRTDVPLQNVDERRNVVVGDLLALENGVDEGLVDHGSLGAAGGCRAGRDRTDSLLCVGREQFDVDPTLHACGVGEQIRHLGQRIAIDHGLATQSSRSGPVPIIVTGTPTTRSTNSTSFCAFGARSAYVAVPRSDAFHPGIVS